jgi:GTP-binding protein HflX
VRVALVGYTNVGKSTIMNLISKSEVLAENKLFATLDSTVRKVVLDQTPFLLSDTVGFIRKLPHQLIECFKSTLDEVREADLLLHVIDISNPSFEDHINIVKLTLEEIGAGEKPVIMVFNKIDAYVSHQEDGEDQSLFTLNDFKKSWMAKENTPALFISATQKENIEELRNTLLKTVRSFYAFDV